MRTNVALCTSVVFVLTAFISIPETRAQRVEVSARPSFSVILVEHDANAAVVAEWRSFQVERSYVAERADIDLFRTISLDQVRVNTSRLFKENTGRKQVVEAYFPTAVKEITATYPLGRLVIDHLFMVNDDFEWSLGRLMQRAQYAQTTTEAAVEMTSMRGGLNTAADRALNHVSRAYAIVLLPDVVEREVVVEEKGQKVTRVVTVAGDYHAALLKLNMNSVAQVRSELERFYCEKGCADREARKAAYARANFDFEVLWHGTARSEKKGAEMCADIAQQIVDAAIRAVPSLQYEALVLTDHPVRARIGRKEGVAVGRRYAVVRQYEDRGTRRRDHRGYVRAQKVTDNRGMALTRSAAGKEEIVAYEPSTFKQVHGRTINAFDVLVEKPDLGLNILAGYRGGNYDALGVDVLYRIPGTLSTLAGVTGELFYEDSEVLDAADAYFGTNLSEWITIRGGVALAHELILARGYVRVLPFVSGSYQQSLPLSSEADEDVKIEGYSYRAGLNATLQFAFNFGLFAGTSYQGLFGTELNDADGDKSTITWSDLFEKGTGVQFEGGIRINL